MKVRGKRVKTMRSDSELVSRTPIKTNDYYTPSDINKIANFLDRYLAGDKNATIDWKDS